MSSKAKEKRFLDELEALFTGAEVEGDSGFVNLMRMKRDYFRSIRPQLMAEIDKRAEQGSPFREELFDKLYTFFHRYFCESGSIYFRHLPAFSKTYERVYEDGQDVALSWKTQMLYYVKSDVLVRSMPVELSEEGKPQNTKRFYFDASEFEGKQNNEKREFVFTFKEVKREKSGGGFVHLKVSYSQRGTTTKTDEIIRQSRKAGISLTDEHLQKAIGVFRRQIEADFFINKDARGFLREQFDLWMYQYIFQEETIFEQKRLAQLQAIKDTAYNIIDFIAQFEDELRRVWEKPKFVRNVNYVVTIDKLTDGVLKKIIKHLGAKKQIAEWQELGMVDDKFSMKDILSGQKNIDDKNGAGGNYRFLPLDTKHFKDLELEILDGLGNLDEALDGELVHSENWQALNTLHKRYKEKVQTIFIDPPFNLDSSDQFLYRTNYKDASWATLLENRLKIARDWLNNKGSIFVRCDYNGNYIVRCLLDEIFGKENFRNEIIINKSIRIKTKGSKFPTWHDTFYFYSKNSEFQFFKHTTKKREQQEWRSIDTEGESYEVIPKELIRLFSKENIKLDTEGNYITRAKIILGKEILPRKGRRFPSQETIVQLEELKKIRLSSKGNPQMLKPSEIYLTDNWSDLYGYANKWNFSTENSELGLKRIIESTSKKDNLVIDFFLGSGTTMAVAHKLGRKWLGVEMGDHFYSVVLPRMKKVLAYDKSGISKEIKKYKGGGAFKYYTMEQYEETLRNSRYEDSKQLEIDSTRSPFEQYVFFGDDKLAHAVKSSKNGELDINLQDLYPDIDIAESLSNILGKQIRKRNADSVIFEDGTIEKTDSTRMTKKEKQHFISLIKPYLWWGE